MKKIEEEITKRLEIVMYLYENGATFGNGEINYTDLICFAMKSDSFLSARFFFEEAIKNNAKLDFSKIIKFTKNPGFINYCNGNYRRYRNFEEEEDAWFRICEEYSRKLDSENHQKNVKLLLEKCLKKYGSWYMDIIDEFSRMLPKEELKDIPAIIYINKDNVGFNDLDSVVTKNFLDLGFDINSLDNNKNNILFNYVKEIVK